VKRVSPKTESGSLNGKRESDMQMLIEMKADGGGGGRKSGEVWRGEGVKDYVI